MFDAIIAEGLKLRRHRATWLMVWIYPIAFALLVLAQFVRDATHMSGVEAPAASAAIWIQQSTLIWGAPLSGGGRFLIAGFAALVFAGEYGWNTWKLIIPARSRWQLIAAKWTMASLLVFLGFAAADIVGLLGSMLRPLVGGAAIPANLTVAELFKAHAAAGGHAVVPILYTVAWAGLFAVLTTSVLATVILSIAMILLEQLVSAIGVLAYGYAPWLASSLLEVLPFYHVANLTAWARGQGLVIPLGAGATLAHEWAASMCAVTAWLLGMGAVTIIRFRRQDMN